MLWFGGLIYFDIPKLELTIWLSASKLISENRSQFRSLQPMISILRIYSISIICNNFPNKIFLLMRFTLIFKLCKWFKYNRVQLSFLKCFLDFTEFGDKNICHSFKPATSYVRDQDATTVRARHMWETRSLNWHQLMLQWFIRFPKFAEFIEFPIHLGKTVLSNFLMLKQNKWAYKLNWKFFSIFEFLTYITIF